jgi:hypothetical protein
MDPNTNKIAPSSTRAIFYISGIRRSIVTFVLSSRNCKCEDISKCDRVERTLYLENI